MKDMKRVKPSKRQQKNETSAAKAAPAELSSFSLAAAISEASTASSTSQPSQHRKIFNISNLRKNSASQASIATNTSFATANESQQAEPLTPASYFVDSSDDETNEDLNFGNDPLAVLSRRSTSASTTPTEITFNINPEETMPSKKSKKAAPVVEATAVAPTAAKKPDPAPETKKPDPSTKEDGAHFDVAQNVYGTVKNVWAWGTTLPIVSNMLGLTEVIAAKVVETTIHMDLPAIDQQAVVPNLKKLDDVVVNPVILAVWKIVEPAIVKSDEMIVKPVMTEVVPRVLAPLKMFDQKSKELEAKKEEEKRAMIDKSPTPEIVPALN